MDMPINRADAFASTDTVATSAPVFEIIRPQQQTLPIVFASPHSGVDYSPEFIAASRLDPLTLRKSEDSFVDELFGAAPEYGAPMLRALFPRAYVDPNREPFELDPDMFAEHLPDYTNTESPRVAAGLGTIARLVCSGAEIYDRKLNFGEALDRINRCYRPYHAALTQLIEETCTLFGTCILIDCHSMPSIGGPMDRDPGRKRVDFVLGDRHGAACDHRLTDLVRDSLGGMDYVVRRNLPYAGAFTTGHYGVPERGVHALQIEINRALYMDEDRFEKTAAFAPLRRDITRLIKTIGELKTESLAA
jgi:N-formylglutamate amidohydrolase